MKKLSSLSSLICILSFMCLFFPPEAKAHEVEGYEEEFQNCLCGAVVMRCGYDETSSCNVSAQYFCDEVC